MVNTKPSRRGQRGHRERSIQSGNGRKNCKRFPPLLLTATRGYAPHRGGPAPSSSDSYKLITDAVNKRGFSLAPIPKGLGSANASLHIYQPAKTAQGRVKGSKFKRVVASPLEIGPCWTSKQCTNTHQQTIHPFWSSEGCRRQER